MNNEIENIISHIQPEEDSEKMLNYIEELEQQNKELGENEQHYKKVYLEELALKSKVEQQKAELVETLDIAIDILSDCNYSFILGKEILEKYK